MRDRRIRRRDIVRAVPLVIIGSAVAGIGRFLMACTSEDDSKLNTGAPEPGPPPTDGDEYVPPNGGPPANAGDTPPVVPNPVWEARAKQLEDEQARVYGAVFTAAAPGVMVGKDRSHVPVVTLAIENTFKRVTALVQHVMGKNGLDAGTVDASDAADAKGDGGGEGGGDGGGEGGEGGIADAAPETGPVVEASAPPEHYITTVYLRADVNGKDTVVGLWEFASTDPAPPSVKFTLPLGVTSVVAFEWCTIHGLWKALPLPV